MKLTAVILFSLCCVAHFSSSAQTPSGFTYTSVNGRNTPYRLPGNYASTNPRRYPLVLFFHGNGEGGALGEINTAVLYTADGLGRALTNTANLTKPEVDSFIFVLVQTGSGAASNTAWPDVVVPIIQYFDANFRTDTTRGMLTGFSQGARNVIDLISRPAGAFGGNYHPILNRFKKNVIVATPFPEHYGDSTARWAGRGYRGVIGSTDSYVSQQADILTNYINSYGGYGTNRVLPGVGHVQNPGATDSAFSFQGTDTLTNVWLWFLAAPTNFDTLKPHKIYSLSNEWGHLRYSYPPERLFDGVIGNGGLPELRDRIAFIKGTMGIGKTDYPKKKELCHIWKMTGDSNQTNLAAKDTIVQIGFYNNYFYSGDSAIIYNLDPVLANPDMAYRAQVLADPSHYLTPVTFFVTDSTQNNTWIKKNIDVTATYLLARYTYRTHYLNTLGGDSVYSWAKFQEAIILGKKNLTPVTLRPFNFVPTPAANFGASQGVNTGYQSNDSTYSDGTVRWYYRKEWLDTASTKNIGLISRDGTNDGAYMFNQSKRFIQQGKHILLNYRGANKYLQANGKLNDRGVNVDSIGADPELSTSYTRAALVAERLTGLLGRGTYSNTAHFDNDADFTGLNTNAVSALEPEFNEANEYFNDLITPQVFHATYSALWDGDEGRMPGIAGIRGIDTSMEVWAQATAYIDYGFYESVWWLSQVLRSDKRWPFHVVNVHHYPSIANRRKYLDPTADNSMTYIRGASVEKDSTFYDLNNFIKVMNGYMPGIKVGLSESGYENIDTSSAVYNPSFTWYGSPKLGGYTKGQARAMHTLRLEIMVAASGLYKYHYFMLQNPSYQYFESTGYGTFANSGRASGGPAIPNTSELYFMNKFKQRYLGHYKIIGVEAQGPNMPNVVVFQHTTLPDSICKVAWMGVDSINTSQTYSFAVNALNNQVKRVDHIFNQGEGMGAATTIAVSGGNASTTITGAPTLLFYQTTTTPSGPGPLRTKSGTRWRLKN